MESCDTLHLSNNSCQLFFLEYANPLFLYFLQVFVDIWLKYLSELVPPAAQLSMQILLLPWVGAELQGCPLFSEEL